MDGINSERPVSRRYVQGPRMGRRLEREVARVARVLHGERVRAWAAGDEGDYPRVLEARGLVPALQWRRRWVGCRARGCNRR